MPRLVPRHYHVGLWVRPAARTAFTLVELLVVIAIIAILAGLLLPTLIRGRQKSQGLSCMNSHRQLTLAWRMYCDDFADVLPFASRTPMRPELDRYSWVLGDLDFDPTNADNWDADRTIKRSPLWPYCGQSTEIWRCPADHSALTVKGVRKPRVRSMSMNLWVGGFGGTDGALSGGWMGGPPDWYVVGGSKWRVFLKMNEIIDPGPSRTFLLMDMREDSVDWGNFATDMTGWPDQPQAAGFYDLPANYHYRAGGLSFVDGHAEIHRWRDDRTMPPLVLNGEVTDTFGSPNNPDVRWLQEHATRLK